MKIEIAVGKLRNVTAKAGGEPPEWLLIFPSPVYRNDDGEFLVDDLAKRLIVDEFERRGNDLVIDYEHQTLFGGEAPAAGWIKELADRGDEGLWGRVEWTEKAAERIRAGEYRYHSPVYDWDVESRRVIRIHHLALTNWPRSHDQPGLTEQQIAAKARGKYHGTEEREGVMKKVIEKLKGVLTMPLPIAAKALRTEIEGLLELIPDSDETVAAKADGVTTVLEALGLSKAKTGSVQSVAAKPVLDELGLAEGATVAQVVAKIGELKTPTNMVSVEDHEKVKAELATAKADLEKARSATAEQEIETLIESNRSKISPAREPWIRSQYAKYGIEHTKEVIENLPDELPSRQATGSEPKADPSTGTGVSTVRRHGKELPVDEGAATLTAKVEKVQREAAKAGERLSYDEAYARLQERELGG